MPTIGISTCIFTPDLSREHTSRFISNLLVMIGNHEGSILIYEVQSIIEGNFSFLPCSPSLSCSLELVFDVPDDIQFMADSDSAVLLSSTRSGHLVVFPWMDEDGIQLGNSFRYKDLSEIPLKLVPHDLNNTLLVLGGTSSFRLGIAQGALCLDPLKSLDNCDVYEGAVQFPVENFPNTYFMIKNDR